jgi:thiamine kinase-like enzyme
MNRFETIADLTNPQSLSTIFGPVKNINTKPFNAIGFSGAILQRVELISEDNITQHLILKQANSKNDWLSQRTHDAIGREAAWLNEDCLAKTWNIIHCPYIAFAQDNGTTGLLMKDLSAHLFPDNREPIDITSENIIIDAMAAMHALFWESNEVKQLSWLMVPHDYLNLLRPGEHEEDNYCPPPEPLRTNMEQGWKIAFELLPSAMSKYLTQPIEKIFACWKDLPATFLHGDLKIANMAIMPGGKLALFDWSLTGCAPCGIELGWYLAVNSTRLARTKEEFIDSYKRHLESHLQYPVDDKTWTAMIKLAIVSGSMMMLWSKALGWKSGTERGRSEWEWWRQALEEAIA